MATEEFPSRPAEGDEAPPERGRAPGPDREALLAEVRDVAFPVALRGYDREAVDAYVVRVNRLIAELEASRSPESAVRRALDRVGQETSSILHRAQQTADEITERSRAQADDRLQRADREAAELRREAEGRVRELDADFEAVWQERRRLIEDVRRIAGDLEEVAEAALERFPEASPEMAAAEEDDVDRDDGAAAAFAAPGAGGGLGPEEAEQEAAGPGVESGASEPAEEDTAEFGPGPDDGEDGEDGEDGGRAGDRPGR